MTLKKKKKHVNLAKKLQNIFFLFYKQRTGSGEDLTKSLNSPLYYKNFASGHTAISPTEQYR